MSLRNNFFSSITLATSILLLTASCGDDPQPDPKPNPPVEQIEITVPTFNRDSAYAYVAKQVSFGPRVPETDMHAACADWMRDKLASFGWQSQLQEAIIEGYESGPLAIKNVIGSYKPELKNRVLLCAHWDTRRMADQDTARKTEPILGADDGGSGVGILLELARVIGADNLEVGIDIVFFDAEDQGESNSPRPAEQTWCLGSQYWSGHPHEMAQKPEFGILLDMVGYSHARFPKEGVSANRAPALHQAVWKQAQELGYSDLFVQDVVQELIDDHLYINDIAKIPTIDIINLPTNPAANRRFGYYWHTHHDNMDIIGKHTLNAVGKTLLRTLYKHEKGILFK
jgi:hypothetical protein